MTSHHNLKTKPPNVFCATIKRGALQGEKWATKAVKWGTTYFTLWGQIC